MTRAGRPEGRPEGVGTHRQSTPSSDEIDVVRGSYIHLTGDAELFAAELVERLGPSFAELIAAELIAATSWTETGR